jgi:hypothetical protein
MFFSSFLSLDILLACLLQLLLRVGDAPVYVEPDLLLIVIEMLEDLAQSVLKVKRYLELLKLEVGTICCVLGDETHLEQDFLYLLNSVSIEDPSLQ